MAVRLGRGVMFANSGPNRRWAAACHAVLWVAITASLVSCGGGGSSQSQTPDFSLTPSPSSLSMQQLDGGHQLTISITPLNGFSNSVTITFPNLPAGITTIQSGPFTASPGLALNVGIAASQAAAVGSGTITVQGTSGSLTHTATVSVSVAAAAQFQITATPSTATIGPNGLASAQITLVPGANFGSSSVFLYAPSVHLGSTGVDLSISAQSLTAAQPQATISFQSSFEVQPGNNIPVPVTGTLGAQVVPVPLTLDITNPAQPCKSLSRSSAQRTDTDATGVVYDPVHKLVFAAIQQNNVVQVYSSATAQNVASIPIPAPRQLDITADGSRILVGSLTRYLFWVDPVSFQVVGQVPVLSPIFNGSFTPTPLRPVILASGKVLVAMGDGPPNEWDPVTNTWTDPTPSGFASGDAVIRRSADHTKVVVASINGTTLAVFDSATDKYGTVQNLTTTAAALNSDGSKIAVLEASPTIPGGNQVALFDKNFNVLATYQLNAEVVPTDLIFSRDNSLVFAQAGIFTTALSATDLSFVGELPSPGSGGVDYPSDIDETGMIFSPNALRSVVFTDASAPCALGVNLPYNMSLNPPQGTMSSPSAITVNAVGGITSNSRVYFGAPPGSMQATPGTNPVASPPTAVQVTPPSGQAVGPVNVTVTNPDGSVGVLPNSFSYGSSVPTVLTNSGPATQGTSVTIYGYGLAFDQSQIQVTVGGSPAVVTDAFAGQGIWSPLQRVVFNTPSGNAGPADIVVTTPVGSATVSGGFHFLQNVQSYPVSSTLAQVVYDQLRKRLYAADSGTNQVYVFDLTTQKYLTPITVGNSPEALAITPDSNTLVVSNGADNSVSIVDLTGTAATKTVSVMNLPNLPSQCGPPTPYAVETTSKNQAVIALQCPNVTEGEFIVLDLATQQIGCGTSTGCAAMLAAFPQYLDWVLALAATTDGSKILLSNGGTLGLWDVNADTFLSQPSGDVLLQSPVVVSAAAADGTTFAQFYGIQSPLLYNTAIMQDPDYIGSGIFDVYSLPGEKLHPSGALLYYPDAGGLSIYDAHHGHLVRRIALPETIASTFDAMAIDPTGSQIFMISSTGLTIVSLADMPLSMGNVSPAQGAASGGVTVKLRGSGFQSGAQVLFNNTHVGATFIDGSTLQVNTPPLVAGPVRITVVNPDGGRYFLDDAYTAQ